jgi:hypothetical protein
MLYLKNHVSVAIRGVSLLLIHSDWFELPGLILNFATQLDRRFETWVIPGYLQKRVLELFVLAACSPART